MKVKKVITIALAITLLTGSGFSSILTNPVPVSAADITTINKVQDILDLPAKENVAPDKVWTIKFNSVIDPALSSHTFE